MEQLVKAIQGWAEAERAYVMTVINNRVGSPEEIKALRVMEDARQAALSELAVKGRSTLQF